MQATLQSDPYGLYIGGEFVEPVSGDYLESENPASGEVIYRFADAGAADVDRAVRAAREALDDRSWSGISPTARGQMLRRVADTAEKHLRHLAEVETADNGKLLRETVAAAAALPVIWEYFAGWADKVRGDVIPTNDKTLNYLVRQPVGVVAAIIPWNAPLALASNKIAAALVSGNTMVVKPSEITTAPILEFVKILEEAGLPKGVVNVVTGGGATAGAALVGHRGIDMIAFTGGTETGRAIAHAAAERHVKCLLELGGKSPNVVFNDANLDNAANGILAGMFAASGGQACTAGSRVYLQRDIYDEVLARVRTRASAIVLGEPTDPATDVGPVAYRQHMDRILDHIETANTQGAQLLLGGRRAEGAKLDRGYYVEPTIFEGVNPSMSIFREEVFGPVLAAVPFDDEEGLVASANDSDFGLVAGIWTSNLSRAHRVAARLDAGTVWVNTYRVLSPITPFGGVKASGHGKEGSLEAVLEYTVQKSVWVNLEESPTPDPFVGQK